MTCCLVAYLNSLQVRVTREKITWPGATIKKKGEGMPSYDNNNLFGDLFITFDVEFPRGSLEAEEKEGTVRIYFTKFIILQTQYDCDLSETSFLSFPSCDKTSKAKILSERVQWFIKDFQFIGIYHYTYQFLFRHEIL